MLLVVHFWFLLLFGHLVHQPPRHTMFCAFKSPITASISAKSVSPAGMGTDIQGKVLHVL